MAKLTFGHLMERIYKLPLIKNTRLCFRYSLVFFLLAIFGACKHHDQQISLVWKDHLATGIQIPQNLIKDAATQSLKVTLAGRKDQKGILGDFTADDDVVLFKPLIPLSPGLSYAVLQDSRVIGNISVPFDKNEHAPVLLTIYPEKDTLPENLLKFYFCFSKPMRTGNALSYVYLLDAKKDTMRNVFLDLHPELWDITGTVLTLWLDPGRIKRGLVLNRKLGNPLKKAETYTLVISQQWKDSHGLKLAKNYTRQFLVGDRDSNVPDVKKWQLNIPKAGTKGQLTVNLNAPLDHYLLQESIEIMDTDGQVVKGTGEASGQDQLWKFTPAEPWKAQSYQLRVKATLEDLTGNNLNRVFDRDITKEFRKDADFCKRIFKVGI